MSRYSERIKLLTQHEIVESLRAAPLSAAELAHKLDRGRANVDSYLQPMVEAGHLTVALGAKPARGPRPVTYSVGRVPLPPVAGPGAVAPTVAGLGPSTQHSRLVGAELQRQAQQAVTFAHTASAAPVAFARDVRTDCESVTATLVPASPIERATQEARQAQKVREFGQHGESGPLRRWVTPKPPTAQPPLPARPKDLDLGHFGKAAGPVDSLQPGETLEDDDALED